MGRNLIPEKIKDLIYELRSKIPGIYIRTSFIVGFPGESEKQFEELLKFIQDVQFENLGAFIYSREEGTKAYNFSNQIPENVKEERYHRLMTLQRDIVVRKNKSLVGKKLLVLIDETDSEENCSGRFYGQAPLIDGKVLVKREEGVKKGELIEVTISGVYNDYDLLGYLDT